MPTVSAVSGEGLGALGESVTSIGRVPGNPHVAVALVPRLVNSARNRAVQAATSIWGPNAGHCRSRVSRPKAEHERGMGFLNECHVQGCQHGREPELEGGKRRGTTKCRVVSHRGDANGHGRHHVCVCVTLSIATTDKDNAGTRTARGSSNVHLKAVRRELARRRHAAAGAQAARRHGVSDHIQPRVCG